ncbi:MAG: DUF2892 domain-containing protein [Bacteroidota bacterium]|jgi:Na+(H+)/acetate symporter ActP
MKKNMGSLDKVIRILAALVVLILYLVGQITGTAAIILGVFAVVFVATSLISFCPLYSMFKINTGKTQEK